MVDLHLLLDAACLKATARARGVSLQKALYEALRSAIAQGRVQAGAMLPSSRELARELAMARNGVIHAYEQLAAEGYVEASRQGTIVAALGTLPSSTARRDAHSDGPSLRFSRRVEGCDRRRTPEDDLRPFMPGMPALDAFPVRTWQRLCERAARQGGGMDLGYRHAMGEPELRQAIATYLRAARGVRCHADQVAVTDGTQHSLALCAQILADVGDTVWIEHPGYGGARTAFRQAGLNPLGSVLSLPRRLALIERARHAGAWILEDDYDSEFRHDGPPLAAMQGQVPDAPVLYLGTFSKSMFPALRLGFIVWPESVADRVMGILGELVRGGRADLQRAMAGFIDEGHFTRHLRRTRKLYAARQQALREALLRHWPLPGALVGGQAGIHLVLSLPDSGAHALRDADLAQAAADRGLSPRPLSIYGTGGIDGFNGLVMGYASTHEDRMDACVRTMVSALDACRG